MVKRSSHSFLRHCFSAALILIGGDALANDALLWLEKMSSAMRDQNYSGTFIYIYNDQVETIQIEHRNTSEGVSERLFSLNGEPREIVRNNSAVTCIFPDSKSVIVDVAKPQSRLPTNLPTDLSKLDQHYNIFLGKDERVTERNTKVINIEPNDHYRYGYRLWIDAASYLMVRSAILNEDKKAVEQVLFTSLQIDENVPDQSIKPKLLEKDFKVKAEVTGSQSGAVELSSWRADKLPPGFNLSMHKGRSRSEGMVDQLVYSDGMASVSVFIEISDQSKKRLKGDTHMGAVHIYGTVVSGHHITVVGEVPSDTVKLIGQSIVANN